MKKGVSVKVIKRFSIFLSVLIIVLSFSACSVKKTQGDNRTIITGIKTAKGISMGSDAAIPKGTHITDELRYLMYKNEGQDVWFRVFYSFTDQQGYYKKYDAENEEFSDDEFSKFMTAFEQQELDFATSIGAKNISKKVSSDYPETCTMEVTADMINKIFERGNMSFDIAHPARIEGYSKKTSDTLTDRLSKMSDTDAIEVAAVSVYDNYNYYAYCQNIGVNFWYNNSLFKVFSQGYDMTFAECDALLEQTVVDILKRNNILEKRVVSDDLPQIGFGEVVYPHAAMLEDIPVGFNAVLTKTEILKLAEDEEIKVIYLAGQN